MNILTVNLLFSTLVFWVAARLYVLPKLREYEPRRVLVPILLLRSLRHLGLIFLAPGTIYAGMPTQFGIRRHANRRACTHRNSRGRDRSAKRKTAGLAIQYR
jgi:hypothetical protein